MSEKTCKIVRTSYGRALSVMTVTLGALLIFQALSLYLSGNTPAFSEESVSSALKKISPAFWIWVVMVVGGFVVWEVFPLKEKIIF